MRTASHRSKRYAASQRSGMHTASYRSKRYAASYWSGRHAASYWSERYAANYWPRVARGELSAWGHGASFRFGRYAANHRSEAHASCHRSESHAARHCSALCCGIKKAGAILNNGYVATIQRLPLLRNGSVLVSTEPGRHLFCRMRSVGRAGERRIGSQSW